MKTPIFDYTAPTVIDDVIAQLERRPGGRLLAGGQSLLVDLKMRRVEPNLLVDLRNVSALRGITLPEIEVAPAARPAQPVDTRATVVINLDAQKPYRAGLVLGAMTTCTEIAENPVIQDSYSALAEAARSIGDQQVRNMATLGGSLAQNDPAGDLQAAVLALGGTIRITGPGGARSLGSHHFFTGPRQTTLGPTEIITAIEFPAYDGMWGSAYEKMKNPASGYAIVGVAAFIGLNPGKSVVRVAVTGAVDNPEVWSEIEAQLGGKVPTLERIQAVAGRANLTGTGISDTFGSSEYRAHIARVLAERALLRALNKAQQI